MKLFSKLPSRRPIAWSAVFAGAITSITLLAVWVLLGASIGLALPGADPMWFLGGAAAWYAAGVILCVAIGAYIAGHWCNGALDRDGVIHGMLSWAASYAFIILVSLGGLGAGAMGAMAKSSASQAPMISAIGSKDYEGAKDEYLALQNPGFQAWLKAKARNSEGVERPDREGRGFISDQDHPRETTLRDEPLVIYIANETPSTWGQATEFVRTHRPEINAQIQKTKDAAEMAAAAASIAAAGIFLLAVISIGMAAIAGRSGLKRAAETPVDTVVAATVIATEGPTGGTPPLG